MPDPGSKAYDNKRAQLRKEYTDQGLDDSAAGDRANEVLQGERPKTATDPSSRRQAGTGRAGRGRGSG